MAEFIISTDLSVIPQKIEFNYEQLKSEISAKMSFYSNLVVTEDSISDAKSTRAQLNKLKTAIDTKRKEIKAQVNEPYTAFEKKVKEITGIIDTAIGNIDNQTAAFAEKAKQEKYNDLKEYFESSVGELAGIINIEAVLDPKWGNVTNSAEKIKADMDSKLFRIKNDLKILSATCKNSDFFEQVRGKYIDTLDMSAALAEMKRLDERRKMFERAEKITAQHTEASAAEPAETCSSMPQETDPVLTLKLSVTAPKSKLKELKNFLQKGGYIYE